jgi:hypothetical protein
VTGGPWSAVGRCAHKSVISTRPGSREIPPPRGRRGTPQQPLTLIRVVGRGEKPCAAARGRWTAPRLHRALHFRACLYVNARAARRRVCTGIGKQNKTSDASPECVCGVTWGASCLRWTTFSQRKSIVTSQGVQAPMFSRRATHDPCRTLQPASHDNRPVYPRTLEAEVGCRFEASRWASPRTVASIMKSQSVYVHAALVKGDGHDNTREPFPRPEHHPPTPPAATHGTIASELARAHASGRARRARPGTNTNGGPCPDAGRGVVTWQTGGRVFNLLLPPPRVAPPHGAAPRKIPLTRGNPRWGGEGRRGCIIPSLSCLWPLNFFHARARNLCNVWHLRNVDPDLTLYSRPRDDNPKLSHPFIRPPHVTTITTTSTVLDGAPWTAAKSLQQARSPRRRRRPQHLRNCDSERRRRLA